VPEAERIATFGDERLITGSRGGLGRRVEPSQSQAGGEQQRHLNDEDRGGEARNLGPAQAVHAHDRGHPQPRSGGGRRGQLA
jgi:hypothetical protein